MLKPRKRFTLATLFLTGILFSIFLFSCKDKKDTLVLDYLYEYFPTDSGHFVVYDVDSIFYSFNGQHHNDTVHYQQMEMITDTTYDNENMLNYVLTVFRRPNANYSWYIDKVWEVKSSPTNLIKKEDDLRFIKLIFPPVEGAEWNGNIFIPSTTPYDGYKDWAYSYETVNVPYTVNGFSFDSTVTVKEVDDENLIQKKLRREVYAKGVGMIYQEWEIVNKQNVQANWETGVENGFRIRMRVADHN